jgi:4-oxalocrotonate tautomerase
LRRKSPAVSKTLGYGDDAVSVSIEDAAPKDWVEKGYRPDITDKPEQLYKKPGYNPL